MQIFNAVILSGATGSRSEVVTESKDPYEGGCIHNIAGHFSHEVGIARIPRRNLDDANFAEVLRLRKTFASRKSGFAHDDSS